MPSMVKLKGGGIINKKYENSTETQFYECT